MKKPYLLSLASYSDGVDRYLDSLVNLQDSVVLVIADFKPSFPPRDLPISEVQHIYTGVYFAGNVGRFDFVPLDSLEVDRWWIFTDTADVIFQGPIPDLDDSGADIIVSSEGERFDQNWVWIPVIKRVAPEMDCILPLTIYCMGTWAMKGYWAKDMINFLHFRSLEIPLGGLNDQPFLNMWLMNKHFTERYNLFASLYKNAFVGDITKDSNGVFWQRGVKPAVVHGNGSGKQFFDAKTPLPSQPC